MIIVFISIVLYLIIGFNGVHKSLVYQAFDPNLFTFVYSFYCWSSIPFYTYGVDLFGVILTFAFTPQAVWIFLILLYLQLMTYFKTNRSLVATIYVVISTFFCLMHCFLVLHQDYIFIFFYTTLIILGVFLIFLYLFLHKKKTDLIVLVSKLEEEPHIPTKLSNVIKAFTLIPTPVSSIHLLQRFFYYDIMFGFISFFGFIKTHFFLVLIGSNYCLSKSSFYLFLSGSLWISLSLALLVFDTKWCESFKLYNGNKVLYLLGYNNIYTNLSNTLVTAGIYGLIVGLVGLTEQAECSPFFGGTAEEKPRITLDCSSKEISVHTKIGPCEQLITGPLAALDQMGEEGRKAADQIIKIGCGDKTTAPALVDRIADTTQRVVESWTVNPDNKPPAK